MDEQTQKKRKEMLSSKCGIRFNKLTTVTIVINNLSSIAVQNVRKKAREINYRNLLSVKESYKSRS